jgi:UDP-N-acetylmuramoyl-tripeptide--D-alanyl-D-alanine ligase
MQAVRISDLIAATHGRAVGIDDPRAGFERIETDSRKVRRGDVFWALSGRQFDGHDFLSEAVARGAALCIVEALKLGGQRLPAVAVDDTLRALWDFGAWYRSTLDTLVVAVTGSVGKTTTRNMLCAALGARFQGVQSPQNYNNHIGVPLSLCLLHPQHEFAAIELAASRVGEIAQLAAIARPEIGVVTAIGPAHLDEFGTLDNIARAKGELLEALPDTGFAVINGDDEQVRGIAGRASCRVLTAGERASNDVVARRIEIDNDSLRFQVDRSRFTVHAAGRHHLTAAVLTVAVAREVGMDDAEIAAGLQTFRPAAGRCQVLSIGDWTVIDDSYNASPRSMHAACELLRNWQGAHHRLLVTGDMLALGRDSTDYHREFGTFAARSGVDRLVAVGAQAATVAGSAMQAGMDAGCLGACHDLETLAVLLDCWLEAGDVVLVKGSRGMQMERAVERLRQLADARKQEARLKKAA